jgi:sensor histidine kinase regulating citrate/malate metabolism
MVIKNWNVKAILKYWLLIAIIVTGLSGLLYAVVQQDIRHTADDPQIQMAEDTAARLANGQQVQNVVPAEKVDIAKSLAPYIIVFDTSGKPIASSAQLDGQTPTIPSGVFDYVRQNGEDRLTWQPQPGVRSAVVVTQFQGPNSGFVLAGRSLREVEKREDDIMQIVLLGCFVMLLITFFASAIIFRKTSYPVPE